MRPIARVAWVAAVAVLALAAADVAAEPKQPATPAPPRTHVVANGDTLSGIAARYRVTVAGIVAANRLAGERVVLRLGQRLVIPASAPAAAPAAAVAAPSTPRRPPRLAAARAEASVPPPRVKPPARGPRGLELEVPDFVEVSPPFTWTVEGPVTSTFGRRRSGWHRGIDIKASEGSVIFAAAAGVVITSAVEPRYGRVVKIEHDDGYLTVYAHNTENLVQAGMRVAAGDPIATIGRTGRATAHHLHFEVRRNGSVYNPLYLLPLPPRTVQVELTDDEQDSDE